ncbi:sulfotransferase [uncultured Cocleimonas sp.]|uniref:sulfotransferase n=1 Tax=uncultured Cocleimonas sp. TaxID=1051587 RepID=UPI002624FF4E|nr:sulfotransferase [uncultured Cocleimonas sp.]
MTHATWDNPEAFSRALRLPHWRKTFTKVIAHDLETFNFMSFRSVNLTQKQEQVWGFKDPRSSITLPIWLDIFPNAKVINIIREGNAVASSLLQRGKNSQERNKIPSLVSLEPALSLDLWAEYVMTANQNCSILSGEKYLELKYEILLESPEATIRQIINFLKIDVNQEIVNNAVSRVKRPNNPVVKVEDISVTARTALDYYGYND